VDLRGLCVVLMYKERTVLWIEVFVPCVHMDQVHRHMGAIGNASMQLTCVVNMLASRIANMWAI
jgi:hypothetical protein